MIADLPSAEKGMEVLDEILEDDKLPADTRKALMEIKEKGAVSSRTLRKYWHDGSAHGGMHRLLNLIGNECTEEGAGTWLARFRAKYGEVSGILLFGFIEFSCYEDACLPT